MTIEFKISMSLTNILIDILNLFRDSDWDTDNDIPKYNYEQVMLLRSLFRRFKNLLEQPNVTFERTPIYDDWGLNYIYNLNYAGEYNLSNHSPLELAVLIPITGLSIRIMELLIKNGHTIGNSKALLIASFCSPYSANYRKVKFLVEKSIPINKTTGDNYNALGYMIKCIQLGRNRIDSYKTIRYMLENGANPNQTEYDLNLNCYDLARESGDTYLVNLLEDYRNYNQNQSN